MKQALFWQIKNKQLECQLCNHYCLIAEGQIGLCSVRKNIKNKLYSLVYGKVISANIDPIEKKPFFHFLPGSLSYSIATVGCNFRCQHCQNADISQMVERKLQADFIPGQDMSPAEIIKQALDNDCQSIAYTYTEPTIFAEFAIDCMKLAKKHGLKNVWVSNGYTAIEVWPKIIPYLDAINVDLKFFNNSTYLKICGAKLRPVLDNLIYLKKKGIHLEVTTLIIPGLNDSLAELKQLADFIYQKLGADTPWHVSRFFPHYKLQDADPTEEDLIYQAYQVGKEAGLQYVYGGNVAGEGLEETYCPNCNALVITRNNYKIKRFDVDGYCAKCQENLAIFS